MDQASGRHPGWPVVRRVTALALTTSLLVSCGTPQTAEREAAATGTSSPGTVAPQTAAGAPETDTEEGDDRAEPAGGPASPPAGNARVLADQLERAAAVLRDPDAAAGDVRRAAEFHQLAVHALAAASRGFRRRVTERLRPQAAWVTRNDLRAALSLRALTDRPQKRLPNWRVVEPPPSSRLLGYYARAQRRTGVPWTYLAAIHLVETRMGRIRGTSTAGAQGPMQFLPPTWKLYGAGGDITDPRDAILAAARLLEAHGAPRDMAGALWHYNPSGNYVRAVTLYARTMQRSGPAYRGYWHWRVLYRHVRGTYVLPIGYPEVHPVLLADR